MKLIRDLKVSENTQDNRVFNEIFSYLIIVIALHLQGVLCALLISIAIFILLRNSRDKLFIAQRLVLLSTIARVLSLIMLFSGLILSWGERGYFLSKTYRLYEYGRLIPYSLNEINSITFFNWAMFLFLFSILILIVGNKIK